MGNFHRQDAKDAEGGKFRFRWRVVGGIRGRLGWFVANDGGWRLGHDQPGICRLAIAEILQQLFHIIAVFGHDGPLVAVDLGNHLILNGQRLVSRFHHSSKGIVVSM
jgi:hypothetical protein